MNIVITLTDQLPGGKNSIKECYVKGRKIRYPNKRFEAWRKAAGNDILIQRRDWPLAVKMAMPFRGDLMMRVSYCEITPVPAKGTRDLTGMQDAIQHLFEQMELIENDGQIKGLVWDYPWRTSGPCAIITLTTMPEEGIQ